MKLLGSTSSANHKTNEENTPANRPADWRFANKKQERSKQGKGPEPQTKHPHKNRICLGHGEKPHRVVELCTLKLTGSQRPSKHVKTRERRGSSFSQLGLEPNHTGLTAQSLFFLEESCRVKRSDTQTFSNFSNYFKRVLKLQKRSSSFSK